MSESVEALRLVLSNPYPYDLLEIRREVLEEFGGNEEEAKENLDAWCSEEFALKAYNDHRAAVDLAKEIIHRFDKPAVA